MKKALILLSVVLLTGIFLVLKFSQAALQDFKTEAPQVVAAVSQTEAQPDMVLVPAGTFQMGNSEFIRSKPVHEVTLTNNFYMGKYEVTNQQYADMLNYALGKGYLDPKKLKMEKVEAWGVSKSPVKYQDAGDEHSQIFYKDGMFRPFPGKENYPVVEVTWAGAAFYCNMLGEKEGLAPLYNPDDWSCQVYGKAGYRLPTEAEWEYAAKYDDGREYPWGNDEPAAAYANLKAEVKSPVDVATVPGGTYSPQGDNKLGICDLAGNMAEWCNDWYNDSYESGQKQTDPVGPAPSLFFYLPFFKEFRAANVVRGGCYLYDPDYRKEYGVPFQVDSILHADSADNSFRSYDYWRLSRHVESFRVVKTVAAKNTKPAFSAPVK
ncbi:MAG: SUMF1/EgtB/PvdO family nonheme iron enzyme [Candidatus Omnitrophota bacterium]|jgi:formylglycine-generating enzyme required for sulfatase activity